MKKISALLLLFLIIATPSHALNILDKIRYNEARLGGEMVLVNRLTGKVEKKMVDGKYETIPSVKGFGGIPSEQDMYQARYDRYKK